MNGLKDKPLSRKDEIVVTIHFVDGDVLIQPLPIDHADGVQKFIDWYRKPGQGKVWTWQTPSEQKLRLIHHHHIECVAIDGYIEPNGRSSRWYERIHDKIRSWWV
jgi:uncharacterized Fe-S cluster-containing radical SAM superfamily enzyme